MWPRRFFAARYFAARYWPESAGGAVVTIAAATYAFASRGASFEWSQPSNAYYWA